MSEDYSETEFSSEDVPDTQEIIRFFRECQFDVYNLQQILYTVIYTGNLGAIVYLHEKGCFNGIEPLLKPSFLVNASAFFGRVHILEWCASIRNKYFDLYVVSGECFNEWTCAYAALGGQMGTLEWLKDPSTRADDVYYILGECKWDAMTCAFAAARGDILLLRWLRDPNTIGGVCEWDERTCILAVAERKYTAIEWVVDNGCYIDDFDINFLVLSLARRQMTTIYNKLQGI